MSADEGAKATPLAMLPIVLGAFREAGEAHMLPAAVTSVLEAVREEVEPMLTGAPEMDSTRALRWALGVTRDSFARHMTKNGHVLSRRDTVTRDAEQRIRQIAQSGAHGE